MSYRAIFTCDICISDISRECIGVKFKAGDKFELVNGGSDSQGKHIYLPCAIQLRDQLNELSTQKPTPFPTSRDGNG